jgi:hypothetical protein
MAGAREPTTFRVRVVAEHADAARRLAEALLDVPHAADDELARLVIAPDIPTAEADAFMILGGADRREADATSKPVFVVSFGEAPHGVEPSDTFFAGGIDPLRAAVLDAALRHHDVPVERARREKRPLAAAIVAGAALATATEALLPGAAAFVVTTQATAIASLHYLYTGKWMGRSQALTILPMFVSETAGGSVFLLVKSFLPPTGVADAAAAIIAASFTVAMLGAIARLLEEGYALDEKEKLRESFQRLRARTRAERADLARRRDRWRDKAFFLGLVRRIVFD